MKKLTLVFILLFAMGSAFSQKALRTTAFNHLRKGQLDKALQSIEPTIADASTMNEAKTWFYRGNIYLQIHMSDKPEYKNLDANALQKAYESYKRMQELDTKNEFKTEAIQNLLVISEQLYNQGAFGFKEGLELKQQKDTVNSIPKFVQSLASFERAIEVSSSFGLVDTTAILNAGLAAENAMNFPKAIQYYTRIIEMDHKEPAVYSTLANVYMQQNQMDQAFATIKIGRQKFPDNFDLLITETNLFLKTNQSEQAMNNLQQAVKSDPLNATIHFAAGSIYEQVGNKTEAEKAYIKAIDLDPEYFDANYNLGALYVNKAAEIQNEANKLKLGDANYDKMKAEADGILQKSLPYLEKAANLMPKDRSTLYALKEIYARLNMYDKLKDVNARIQDL